jgi:hypothetical protein
VACFSLCGCENHATTERDLSSGFLVLDSSAHSRTPRKPLLTRSDQPDHKESAFCDVARARLSSAP